MEKITIQWVNFEFSVYVAIPMGMPFSSRPEGTPWEDNGRRV